MKHYLKYFLLGLTGLLFSIPVLAYENPGKPTGFVNDFAKILTADQKSQLENKLSAFQSSSSNEITVVIIDTLGNDTIENFAVKLFADWKIGQDKKDNGVLILAAIQEKKVRIEVGYGLEGALPDATSFQIINNSITPNFKQGNYYEGFNQATDSIIAATSGEYQTDTQNVDIRKIESYGKMLFFFLFIFFGAWRGFLAKTKSWWLGGVIGGALGALLGLIIFKTIIMTIVGLIALGGFGLLFDYIVSNHKGGRGGGIWFLPGGFGGGSSGGFGGFGGGGSGGGGSSGGW